jgi:3-deoxy-D-manno-octulosonate 8-phosphate phosphatase (KDO 8-P phosphatase)
MAGLLEIAAGVRLAVFDIDGVFTDGRIWMGTTASSTRPSACATAWASSSCWRPASRWRSSPAAPPRPWTAAWRNSASRAWCRAATTRPAALAALLRDTASRPASTAYLGDDTPDLPALRAVGLPAAVADAHPEVLAPRPGPPRCRAVAAPCASSAIPARGAADRGSRRATGLLLVAGGPGGGQLVAEPATRRGARRPDERPAPDGFYMTEAEITTAGPDGLPQYRVIADEIRQLALGGPTELPTCVSSTTSTRPAPG